MIPPLIVRRACELGLDLIAVTDHNSTGNAGAVLEAAQGTGLVVLPGMEVQTREEVHMVCLFDTLDQAEHWEQIVSAALPNAKNNAKVFGEQYVVDATGDYLYTEEQLLATSTTLSVEQVADQVSTLGGLCLPAHVDRPSYSILSNLGFIPPELKIAGIEISRLTTPRKLVQLFPALARYGMIVSSDAHRLQEMAAYTQIEMAAPTLAELRLALLAQQEREVHILSQPGA